MPFEVGQFASDYEILSVLGKGGMGCVYRVRNVISNRTEAMKVLLADVAAEAELGDRFLGEIRTLARLDHPNIAKFYSAFKVENQLVMVMEFVEGVTLSEYHKKGSMPLADVLAYVTQTLSALSYAHANGVVHRDIKPSNIMVTPHGVAKLMDFGIAKSNVDPLLTRPGTTMGSMLYMSPEQVRGTTIDARSDLYSMGILLYELTVGKRPFEGGSDFDILDAQLNQAPKPPIEVNSSIPPALNEIILTAMNKEPMRRFQTAEAFRNALETLREKPVAAKPMAQQAAQPAAAKSTRGLWMAIGAVACVCVLAAGAMMLPAFFKSSAASREKVQVAQTSTQPAAQPPAAQVEQPPAVQSTPTPLSTTQVTTPQVNTPASVPPPQAETSQPHRGFQPVQQQQTNSPMPSQPQYQAPIQAPLTAPVSPEPMPTAPRVNSNAQELGAADESLIKLRARSESIHVSLDNLRSQQAAQGLTLRQDITASASRMDGYLSAADHALQSGNLDSARKSMEHAGEEITKLEAFFGR